MNVGYYQTLGHNLNPEKNIENLEMLLKKDHGAKLDLLVLPELYLTGYVVTREQAQRLSVRPEQSVWVKQICQLAKEFSIALVFGYIESDPDDQTRLYNSALLISRNGNIELNYRKIHLYSGYELALFTPGPKFEKSSFVKSIKYSEAITLKTSLAICYDVEFPEHFRILRLLGADLVVVPTANFSTQISQFMVPSRAVENNLFVIYCNRHSTEQNADNPQLSTKFCGLSLIVGPDAEILAKSENEEDFQMAVIDPEKPRYQKYHTENDYLADRKPEMYRNFL